MLAQIAQDLVQPAIEQAVQLQGAAVAAEVTLYGVAVHHHLVYQLLGQPLEPAPLHRRPAALGIDALHGLVDALLERH